MKHKRLFTLLLALCLILSMVPAGAMAAEAKPSAEIVPGGELMGQVNPMAENLPAAAVRKESAELNSNNDIRPSKYHTNTADAVAELRKAMINRQETIAIGLKYNMYIQGTTEYNLVDRAVAHDGTPDAGDYLNSHWYSWEAQSSGIGGPDITIVYTLTYFDTAEEEKQVKSAVKTLLNELNLWNASDYDKIKGVYDWICTNVAYDYELQGGMRAYSAYGALVNRSAVCQGYASLFYRLMLELGVDCRVITGTVDGEPHAWNIVKLDGVYYYVDATFDAAYRQAGYNYSFFLVGDLNFLDHIADSEYTTDLFHRDYPTAELNYDDSNDIGIFGYCGAGGFFDPAITWYVQDGVLVIYGEGDMFDWAYQSESSPWERYADRLLAVYVDEGITRLPAYAFRNMSSIMEAYVPNTVREIPADAFSGCSSLEWIHLPQDLEVIGEYAFNGCESLKEIEIPDSVHTIGDHAFAYCGLTEITIPASVTLLPNNCLLYCEELTRVVLPEGLQYLGGACMMYCSSLTSITLPESLVEIGDSAFRGTGLTSIVIPKNVSLIAPWAFIESQVSEIYFTGDVPELLYNSFDNITATAYYPAGNETWTEEVMQQYGGTITWKAACEEHNYDHDIKNPTCTENGLAHHYCSVCGLSYEEVLPAAHTYTNDQDTICDVCSCVRHVDAEYPDNPPVVHMFRLYDPNSGEHFYTGSTEERENLVAVGWNYEGVGFSFPVVGAPVYRLYDPVTGEHMYTMDIDEVNYLIGQGWNNEGIAFNTAPETEVPQYRLHNPNETRGAYHFTSSAEERDNLLAVGWEYQGIGWYSCWK